MNWPQTIADLATLARGYLLIWYWTAIIGWLASVVLNFYLFKQLTGMKKKLDRMSHKGSHRPYKPRIKKVWPES